jgi:beta-glucosidase
MPRSAFSPEFLWGVATSAYQIEGAVAEDGRGPTIWDEFSHIPGRVRNGDSGDVGAGHYRRFREDVALMAGLGIDSYRFSIAWSRLLPEGVGRVEPRGVAFYRNLCEALLDAGITPVPTLYHWDLPLALHRRGGWLDRRSVDWFTEYAVVARDQLGDLVSLWTTINEPWCAAFLGYGSGVHAPGVSDPASAYVAAHHLMLAHHAATAAMRDGMRPDGRIGIVLNLIPAWPTTGSVADTAAADLVDAIHNRQFLGGVLAGRYPDEIRAMHQRFGVADRIDPEELGAMRTDIDLLGVNYYNVNHVAHREGTAFPGEFPGADGAVVVRPPGELTEMGWGVEPEGLAWMLDRIARDHPGLPLYVLENGAAYADDRIVAGVVDDVDRIEYLERHLGALADSIERGADVRGYFLWSLLDNFEWSFGYSVRFGIVDVDRSTLERRPKRSALWYRDWIASGRDGR